MGFIPFKKNHETPALAEQTRMFFACENNRVGLKPMRVLLLFLLQLKQEAIHSYGLTTVFKTPSDVYR